jgi:hypothetical protein
VSFFFPLVFWIENINQWDNFYRFVLISSFCSIFVWIAILNNKSLHQIRALLLVTALISLALSIPANINQIANRMSNSWHLSYNFPSDQLEMASFFRNQDKRVMLWPYPAPNDHKCGNNFSDLTGVAIAGFYFNNFLLSGAVEEQIEKENSWVAYNPKALQKEHPEMIHLYVVNISDFENLKNILLKKSVKIKVIYEGSNYKIAADQENFHKLR